MLNQKQIKNPPVKRKNSNLDINPVFESQESKNPEGTQSHGGDSRSSPNLKQRSRVSLVKGG